MSELLKTILNRINNGDNMYKICHDLDISTQRFNYYLSILQNNYFYHITRYATRSGNIVLENDPRATDLFKNSKLTRILNVPSSQSKDFLRTMYISDLHEGSENECTKEFLYQLYNYCNSKGIHVIFCNGDWIDGINTKCAQYCADPREQAERLIRNFPFDYDICVIGVEGDHENSDLNYSFNFSAFMERYRSDIIIIGKNFGRVALGRDCFEMYHKRPNPKDFRNILNFTGHSHVFSIKRIINPYDNSSVLSVAVPTASSILTTLPSCLEVDFELNDGIIQNINIKQLVSLNGKLEPINEFPVQVRKK